MKTCVIVGVVLMTIMTIADVEYGAAETGMTRWFSCGIGFWRPCVPTPDPVLTAPPRTDAEQSADTIAPEALRNWGTPVVGPTGAVSYQLPPRPLLDLFHEPTDANARHYLTWLSEKSRHREAAFAAIKRMAVETGYSVGQMPTGNNDPGGPPEMLASTQSADLSTGLSPHAVAFPGAADSLPQTTVRTPAGAQTVNTVSPPQNHRFDTQPIIGPQTRVFYFFAPQCPYCAQETPLLNAIVRGRTDVVGIAMDTTPEALVPYVQTMRFPFPVMLDRGESRGFGVTGYPTVVVRDDTGAARKLTGLATKEQLQQVLKGVVP